MFNLKIERFHMGIALVALSGIYNGIHKFMNAAAHLESSPCPLTQVHSVTGPSLSTQKSHRALRVLRVSEHHEAPHCAGRMVISGRMADVCAELDRLVALENQNKASLPH